MNNIETIRAALVAYQSIAAHMLENVCESYREDCIKAEEALRLFDEMVARGKAVQKNIDDWLDNDWCRPNECGIAEHVIDVESIRRFLSENVSLYTSPFAQPRGGMVTVRAEDLRKALSIAHVPTDMRDPMVELYSGHAGAIGRLAKAIKEQS